MSDIIVGHRLSIQVDVCPSLKKLVGRSLVSRLLFNQLGASLPCLRRHLLKFIIFDFLNTTE